VIPPLCQLNLLTAPVIPVSLTTTSDQDLATMSAKCNTPTATATVRSLNAFKLRNQAITPNPEIPYRLSVTGGGPVNQNAQFTYDPFNTKNALKVSLANAISPIDTPAGTYSDVIVVTITPES
jgi:hypothetical protein